MLGGSNISVFQRPITIHYLDSEHQVKTLMMGTGSL